MLWLCSGLFRVGFWFFQVEFGFPSFDFSKDGFESFSNHKIISLNIYQWTRVLLKNNKFDTTMQTVGYFSMTVLKYGFISLKSEFRTVSDFIIFDSDWHKVEFYDRIPPCWFMRLYTLSYQQRKISNVHQNTYEIYYWLL